MHGKRLWTPIGEPYTMACILTRPHPTKRNIERETKWHFRWTQLFSHCSLATAHLQGHPLGTVSCPVLIPVLCVASSASSWVVKVTESAFNQFDFDTLDYTQQPTNNIECIHRPGFLHIFRPPPSSSKVHQFNNSKAKREKRHTRN